MASPYQNSSNQVRENNHNRLDATIKTNKFESVIGQQSQREFALEHEVPRTTLQHWLSRKKNIDASPALIAFFEGPDGLAFLHRLITAAHLEFTKVGVASIHNVSNFLKACGLEPFVACSYTTHQRVAKKMDKELIKFGRSERDRLAAHMPSKAITLAEDETFHPQICLVAIEAVSNFIILEKYVQNRNGATWNASVEEALAGLPVKVIQVTSDQGSGLLNHVKKGLGVHHSSDIFHVSYEIGKGTSGPLASEIRRTEQTLLTEEKQVEKIKSTKHCYDNQERRPRGRRPDFEKRIDLAERDQKHAEDELQEARENQETVRVARKNIGHVYHPYDPLTGKKQDASSVEALLHACFCEINKATTDLSGKCHKRIEKAYKVVTNLVSTIAFFWVMVDQHLESNDFTDEERGIMQEYLIPGFYLALVAKKEKDEVRREEIRQQSAELLSIINQHDGVIAGLSPPKTVVIIKLAKECAQIFQRSSSCVEGRNAQLSLRHHGIHRLSDTHLQAQTVIHNFHIKREDKTTPAERFFEAKHGNLFDHLLNNMDYPARPRKRLAMAA